MSSRIPQLGKQPPETQPKAVGARCGSRVGCGKFDHCPRRTPKLHQSGCSCMVRRGKTLRGGRASRVGLAGQTWQVCRWIWRSCAVVRTPCRQKGGKVKMMPRSAMKLLSPEIAERERESIARPEPFGTHAKIGLRRNGQRRQLLPQPTPQRVAPPMLRRWKNHNPVHVIHSIFSWNP